MKLKLFLPFLALMAISSALSSCSSDDDSNVVVSSTDALMLENFILDGMPSTITRSAAGVDFPDSVKFLVYFQNNALPQEDRTYDIGMALYNANKQKVRTFPLYENIKLTFAKSYKMDDKIQIAKDIANGTYLLKPICRGTGEKEWKDMKLADDFALTITISGNEAQLKEAFNSIITLKSIAFDKTAVDQNETFKVTLNLLGNNAYKSVPIFLAQQDETMGYKKLIGETWTPNQQGEGTITLSYAPTKVGNQTYYVFSPLDDEPITQFSIITKGHTYGITVDNIADEIDNILDENALKGTMTLKNYDDQVFSQDIYVMLGSIDMNDFSFHIDSLFTNPQEYQKIHFSTSSLGEEKISFSFNNLNYDSYYAVAYGIKDENGKFKDMSGDNMFFLYTTPSAPSDEEGEDGAGYKPLVLFAPQKMAKCPAISYINGKKVFVIKK